MGGYAILQTWLWIIGGALLVVVFILCLGIWMYNNDDGHKVDSDYFIQFIKEHSASKQVSLFIRHNGQEWVAVNPNEKLPLASTVKIIIAIEYARQAAEGIIDPEQQVKISELDTFYIEKTDGGAHEAWLKQLPNKDTVTIREIAEGMIAFSSNANTDYLIHLLGLENINNLLKDLSLTSHDPLYPFVSALYIPVHLIEAEHLTKSEALTMLRSMDSAEYRKLALDIHHQWLDNPLTDQDKQLAIRYSDMKFQQIWSDRLPAASTEDYVSLLSKLNSKTYFDERIHHYLDPVMEQLMQHPKNRESFVHAGRKGGSTAFVLTNAIYATDHDGNTTELAFFANQLSRYEQRKLAENMNLFQLNILKDSRFREKVREELADQP